MTMFSRVSRRVFWRAPALAFCVGLAAFAGSASAGEVRLQYVNSPQYANSSVSDFGAPALSDRELGEERGTNLEAGAPSASDAGDEVAVILWDEFKWAGGSVQGSGTAAGSVTINSNPQ